MSDFSGKEELFRNQLLTELAILRERHELLQSRRGNTHSTLANGEEESEHHLVHQFVPLGTLTQKSESPSFYNNSGLNQGDRDAIEALFASEDDFTRLFNEGRGHVTRKALLPVGRRRSTGATVPLAPSPSSPSSVQPSKFNVLPSLKTPNSLPTGLKQVQQGGVSGGANHQRHGMLAPICSRCKRELGDENTPGYILVPIDEIVRNGNTLQWTPREECAEELRLLKRQ